MSFVMSLLSLRRQSVNILRVAIAGEEFLPAEIKLFWGSEFDALNYEVRSVRAPLSKPTNANVLATGSIVCARTICMAGKY